MKLIEFLISESKKGWSWPSSIVKVTSTKGGRGVNFYFDYACPPSLSNTLIAPTPFPSSELVTREKYEAALAASKPEWDGEGLPPVGVECEARYRHSSVAEWVFFRCVAVDCEVAFGWTGKKPVTLLKDNFEFRPIRSEADKKRENGVLSLAKAAGAMPFRYGETLSDGELLGSSWYELYDKIAAGEVAGIRID